MLAAGDQWYNLRWSDWIGVIEPLLALWSLGLAYAQASRATSAAVATEKAARTAQEQLQANQLLFLIPHLRLTFSELCMAIENNNRALAKRQLDYWREQASQLQGIMSGAYPEQRELLTLLRQSIDIASDAGTALLQSSKNKAVKSTVMAASNTIGDTCDKLGVWAGRRATEVSWA